MEPTLPGQAQQAADALSAELKPFIDRRYLISLRHTESLMIMQGQSMATSNAQRAPLPALHDAEFKVFSQFGEDGILQYLIHETGIVRDEQVFVEFGVESYYESNTRFLLQANNWRGLILDGSQQHMDNIRRHDMYWRHDLTAVAAWIDRDNINALIAGAGFKGDIGVLSIDIDGNDYWVWEKLDIVNPVIVVVEWNSVFGPAHAVSTPYDPAFDRTKAHHSNLYFGASMRALEQLGQSKGYALIGSNSAGNNLFFVRRDRLGRLKPATTDEAYVQSRFRESRDEQGVLTFLRGAQRYEVVKELPVVETTTGKSTTLRALDATVEKLSS